MSHCHRWRAEMLPVMMQELVVVVLLFVASAAVLKVTKAQVPFLSLSLLICSPLHACVSCVRASEQLTASYGSGQDRYKV